MTQLIVFAALIGLMYVMLILPQQRRVKRHQELIASLEPGDEVMTTAGVYGTLTSIEGDTATLLVAPSIEMKIAIGSVGQLVGDESDDKDGSDDELVEDSAADEDDIA
jgi:preprotein translocase subunit YajC